MRKTSQLIEVIAIMLLLLLASACHTIKRDQDNEFSSDTPVTESAVSSFSLESADTSEQELPTTSLTATQKARTTAATTTPTTQTSPPTTTTRRITKTIMIQEGWTLAQIGARLEANGICTRKDYLNAVNTFDFTPFHPEVVACIPSGSHRCFKYEGYQFPDTYQFYVNEDAANVVGKMLRGAKEHIVGKYQYAGMTTDQIVTLASIIELEAATTQDRKRVSSVMHNRLKAGMKLQVDVGTKYIELYVKPIISGDINRYNNDYNTYKCAALPAGPIGNPGKDALDAAVNPADTNDYYFFTDKQGKYYYFETYQEWQKKWNELNMGSPSSLTDAP